jgi:hypothetical protein
MKIDISKKKLGDKVFTTHDGENEVLIAKQDLITIGADHYTYDGRRWLRRDKHPTAFNSREEFDEYWAQVKE